MHHSMSIIHKEKHNKMQQCIKILLFHIYMKLNMFRVTNRPLSGAQNLTGSRWFFIPGRLFGHVVGGRVRHSVPDMSTNYMSKQPSTCEKPMAASAVLGS